MICKKKYDKRRLILTPLTTDPNDLPVCVALSDAAAIPNAAISYLDLIPWAGNRVETVTG